MFLLSHGVLHYDLHDRYFKSLGTFLQEHRSVLPVFSVFVFIPLEHQHVITDLEQLWGD